MRIHPARGPGFARQSRSSFRVSLPDDVPEDTRDRVVAGRIFWCDGRDTAIINRLPDEGSFRPRHGLLE